MEKGSISFEYAKSRCNDAAVYCLSHETYPETGTPTEDVLDSWCGLLATAIAAMPGRGYDVSKVMPNA